MGLLGTIIFIAAIYLFANLRSRRYICKCETAMIVIEGENVTLTCTKCGKSLKIPGKIFEEKYGKTVQEYVETDGYYISL